MGDFFVQFGFVFYVGGDFLVNIVFFVEINVVQVFEFLFKNKGVWCQFDFCFGYDVFDVQCVKICVFVLFVVIEMLVKFSVVWIGIGFVGCRVCIVFDM